MGSSLEGREGQASIALRDEQGPGDVARSLPRETERRRGPVVSSSRADPVRDRGGVSAGWDVELVEDV